MKLLTIIFKSKSVLFALFCLLLTGQVAWSFSSDPKIKTQPKNSNVHTYIGHDEFKDESKSTRSNVSVAVSIVDFKFESLNSSPVVIDDVNHTVEVEVPYGTKISSVKPEITVSPSATIMPASGVSRNFADVVTYIVNNGGSSQAWQVTVKTLEENTFEVHINFQDPSSSVPTGYLGDKGAAYGNRGNSYNYGWIDENTKSPIDLSLNTRNRNNSTLSLVKNTLLHMQFGDVGGNGGVNTEGVWEISVPNGYYKSTIGVGDSDVDGSSAIPRHNINVENINAVDSFIPTGGGGSSSRFTSGSAQVLVTDDKLTLDAKGGFNTKINSIDIVSLDLPSIKNQTFTVWSGAAVGSQVGQIKVDAESSLNYAIVAGNSDSKFKINPLSGEIAIADNLGSIVSQYTLIVEAGDGANAVYGDVIINVNTNSPSIANDILTFVLAEQTESATIDTADHTINIQVDYGTDLSNLNPSISVSEGAVITPVNVSNFTNQVKYTVTAEDKSTIQDWLVNVSILQPDSFEAHINFQDKSTLSPPGYLADYGKQFGFSSLTSGSYSYKYGWKNKITEQPFDASSDAAGNGNGVGRNRISSSYSSSTIQQKLDGTLVHFQGDNALNADASSQLWSSQPRGNELYWEIEIPNGTYEVRVGLGDISYVDSRHSATVEGYTIIPAYAPSLGETRQGTMIVEVTDGLLTINGLGGFNSKINFIDITPSGGTPVNGSLSFDSSLLDIELSNNTTDLFSTTLSGIGAGYTGYIGFVISDNINSGNQNITNKNEWLELPSTLKPGILNFTGNTTSLNIGDTRSNKVIATAKGFSPAVVNINMTVVEYENSPPLVEDQSFKVWAGEDIGHLIGTVAATDTESDTLSFSIISGNEEGLFNLDTVSGELTTAQLINSSTKQYVLEVQVSDPTNISSGYLTINVSDVVPSSDKSFLSFSLPSQSEDAIIDDTKHEVKIGVPYGTALNNLNPTFKISPHAIINPPVGTDFRAPVKYIITAEDGSQQEWTVNVFENTPSVASFEAHINFQDQSTIPPSGYLKDYGKQYGNASVKINETSFSYGWKNMQTGLPFDASSDVSGNGNGVGRNRIVSSYATSSKQQQLEGTLVHFQGDNILNPDGSQRIWSSQPRGSELFWELQIPNGTYAVTIGLGDESIDTDSRHSATVEGYTIIPAFAPKPYENKSGTIVVNVSDNLLTINGLGGFNSKINYVDVVESSDTPVNGNLEFNVTEANLSQGEDAASTFYSNLSGSGATDVGLVLKDNINSGDNYNTTSNDWLTLPEANSVGNYGFMVNTQNLTLGDKRTANIVASAKGFKPASLEVNLDVTAYENQPPVVDDQSFTVWKEAVVGTAVGTVPARDLESNSFSFEIVSGNEDSMFAIDENSGKITTIKLLNTETTEYVLVVEVGDGDNVTTANVSILVTANVVSYEPIKINFSTASDEPPSGYLRDSGKGFDERGNGYKYGWLTKNKEPIDLSLNTRSRGLIGLTDLQNTLIHVQYNNVNGTSGVAKEGVWEISVPNGGYKVTVGVGDGSIDGTGTTPSHTINAEGVNIINGFVPSGELASSNRFASATAEEVLVTDGRLTIEAFGGFNTKLDYIEIAATSIASQPHFVNVTPKDNSRNVLIRDFQINVEVIIPDGYEMDAGTLEGIQLYKVTPGNEVLIPSNSNDTGGGDAITLTPLEPLEENTNYVFRIAGVEANRIGDVEDRLPFATFQSGFTTGDKDENVNYIKDISGIEFTKVSGGPDLGEGTSGERFSSLAIGPDGRLYASTLGNFSDEDGKIYRWNIEDDGTLSNLKVLTPDLRGSSFPTTPGIDRNNHTRLIIGFTFDPSSTADNLIAYVTHSMAALSGGPEWDGKITRLSGPDLSQVQDIVEHLPRSVGDHFTNAIAFDKNGDMYISQGSNTAGGAPDAIWGHRPERLLSAAVLKIDMDKLNALPSLPLDAYTTDDIDVINAGVNSSSIKLSDGTYNPYSPNSPLTIFSTGYRNTYDLLWHSNGWLYAPTNGTAGNNSTSPKSPSSLNYKFAHRIDGLTADQMPEIPALNGGETQKDWLFKTQGGSYHGHPNPLRGEFVLNHGGRSYSGLPGQFESSYVDVVNYGDEIGPDPNYLEPAYDFGKNKSPNGVIEYKSDAFGGKLKGLIMVCRFSGQDDIMAMYPDSNGDIAETYNNIPGLGGFDDPLDIVEDLKTGNLYISEYDRDMNGMPRLTLVKAKEPASGVDKLAVVPNELIFETTVNEDGNQTDQKVLEIKNVGQDELNISKIYIDGEFASQFTHNPASGIISLRPGEIYNYSVTFAPELKNTALGYQSANLVILSDDEVNPMLNIGLYGLKKEGYGGGAEPIIQDIVNVLGIGITTGWTDQLIMPYTPNLRGDEVKGEKWIKAGPGEVKITPVARYSNKHALPFGWYTDDSGSLERTTLASLASDNANSQTLYPEISSGITNFDPAGNVFGFYIQTYAGITYTEDILNEVENNHLTRVYPVKDRKGNLIKDSYLLAYDDANGDYNDFLFIVENARPYEEGTLVLSFDKPGVGYVKSAKQDLLRKESLVLSSTSQITGSEITLSATEDWIILPNTFKLDTPIEIDVNVENLAVGTYRGQVIATAPNYESASAVVVVDVTEEDVFTYLFNFQTSSDLLSSPPGYTDDVGEAYSLQSSVVGDLNFGWVKPGTLTPAENLSARNRNNVKFGPLLNTFTHLGHPNQSANPTLNWLAEIPNGFYEVKISVGDPNFMDSNHVLDVNGINIINFNQADNNPEGLTHYSNTELIEVSNGILRLSLGRGGLNTKMNYIEIIPFNRGLLTPLITASFDGLNYDEDTYRGNVNVSLSAEVRSGSDDIKIEYVLDDQALIIYNGTFKVSAAGEHILKVIATDGFGNISNEKFSFVIEPVTNAILKIENMTKIPYLKRSFPADDYYTFHRLGNPGQALDNDKNVMRLHNNGSGNLVISDLIISNMNAFTYSILPANDEAVTFPLTIAPGNYRDIEISFIGKTTDFTNKMFKESIQIVSNADNGSEGIATLHGGYSPIPENNIEINAQEVLNAFGFKTNMLSLVNDQGTIDPPNSLKYRPSSNYPKAANVDAGYEGDLILSPTFVQADPNKPIWAIQMSALHGRGSNEVKFVEPNSTNRSTGSIAMVHSEYYYQSLLPRNTGNELLNYGYSKSVPNPFRIAVNNYLTSGGNNLVGARQDLLGVRVYKVIDQNGNLIPNEYIVAQDNIGNGCGSGAANCDWQDNTIYFINIRPEGKPSALKIDSYLVATNSYFAYNIRGFFNNGYPGNELSFTATLSDGSPLPEWLSLDNATGVFSGISPSSVGLNYNIKVTATDLNGLLASPDSFTFSVVEESALSKEKLASYNPMMLKDTDIVMYPNPAADNVSITIANGAISLKQIAIQDLRGSTIQAFDPAKVKEGQQYILPVEKFQSGIYIISLTQDNGSTQQLKLVIEH
ncbi:cadherin domain-containing protein [Leeuwenhoekiella sp. A16]|uniref:cadherin domain-containing protein n=1 Tax=Leeuwenhoekiella sp. A16 TaxID=3141462 RepID=UPI003A7FB5D0